MIARVLAERVLDHPRILVREGERVVELCVSAAAPTRASCAGGPATLLATGGYSALWARTTNPPGSVGDGIVLAYRAGAALADLELVQFHPTVVAGNGLLLSEALRGEGALLLDEERRALHRRARSARRRGAGDRRAGSALLDLRGIDRDRFPT